MIIYYQNKLMKGLDRQNSTLNRYMHRIQQIMGPRNRTPSPINHKNNKTPQVSNFDNYLRYELTFKILRNIFFKHQQKLSLTFFNNLRTYQSSVPQQVYRFVPIEKQLLNMNVDINIAGKIIGAAIKSIVKIKINQYLKHMIKIAVKQKNMPFKSKIEGKQYFKYSKLAINTIKLVIVKKISEYFNHLKFVSQGNKYKSQKNQFQKKTNIIRIIHFISKMIKYKLTQAMKIFQKINEPAITELFALKPLFNCYYIQNKKKIINTILLSMHCSKYKNEEKKQSKIEPNLSNHLFMSHVFQFLVFRIKIETFHNILLFTERNKTLQLINSRKDQNLLSLSCYVIYSKAKNLFLLHLREGFKAINKFNSQQNNTLKTPKSSKITKSPAQKLQIHKKFLQKLNVFRILLSKMMLPMRQAFQQIDLYSNYAYIFQSIQAKGLKALKYQVIHKIHHFSTNLIQDQNNKRQKRNLGLNTLISKSKKLYLKTMVPSYAKMKTFSKLNKIKDQYNVRSQTNFSVTEEISTFLKERSQSQDQYETKFNKIQGIIRSKSRSTNEVQKNIKHMKDNKITI